MTSLPVGKWSRVFIYTGVCSCWCDKSGMLRGVLLRRGVLRMEAAQISPQGRDLSVVFVRREVEAPVDAAALDVPVVLGGLPIWRTCSSSAISRLLRR
jgi:hypothetical protein